MSKKYPHRNFFTKRYHGVRAERQISQHFVDLNVIQIISHYPMLLSRKVAAQVAAIYTGGEK